MLGLGLIQHNAFWRTENNNISFGLVGVAIAIAIAIAITITITITTIITIEMIIPTAAPHC